MDEPCRIPEVSGNSVAADKALNIDLYPWTQLKYIEKYKHKKAFTCLNELDKHDLITCLAPLVYMEETDEFINARQLHTSLMLAQIEGLPGFQS